MGLRALVLGLVSIAWQPQAAAALRRAAPREDGVTVSSSASAVSLVSRQSPGGEEDYGDDYYDDDDAYGEYGGHGHDPDDALLGDHDPGDALLGHDGPHGHDPDDALLYHGEPKVCAARGAPANATLNASQALRLQAAADAAAVDDGMNAKSVGCWKASKLYGEVLYDPDVLVSVNRCQSFCETKDATFFLLSGGKRCACAKAYDGEEVEAEGCDKPCNGERQEKCGGISASSVYVIFDCHEPTPAELSARADAKRREVLGAYASFGAQTCGQEKGNAIAIDRQSTRAGSVDECKLACWYGPGSLQCAGFTYERSKATCTFHADVTAGKPVLSEDAMCYFKRR